MKKYLELKRIEYQDKYYVTPVNYAKKFYLFNYAKKFYLCLPFDKVTGEMFSIMEKDKKAYLDLDFNNFIILCVGAFFFQWKEKSFEELPKNIKSDIRNDFLKEMI